MAVRRDVIANRLELAVAPESIRIDDDERSDPERSGSDSDDPDPKPDAIVVDVRFDLDDYPDRARGCPVQTDQIVAAVAAAAGQRDYHRGEIDVLVTGDEVIHQINRDHLQHDYPTDVISFGYEADVEKGWVQGELVVSVETARRQCTERCPGAKREDWADEVLLYVVHGTLHIAGLLDGTDSQRRSMRAAEASTLMALGWCDERIERLVEAV